MGRCRQRLSSSYLSPPKFVPFSLSIRFRMGTFNGLRALTASPPDPSRQSRSLERPQRLLPLHRHRKGAGRAPREAPAEAGQASLPIMAFRLAP